MARENCTEWPGGDRVEKVRLMKGEDVNVLTIEEDILRRWKVYFEGLMNEEKDRERRMEKSRQRMRK